MILPLVTGSTPVIRLNTVDLPAPFGPISPTISPSRTSMSKSLTAFRPPNCLVSPLTSSIAAHLLPLCQLLRRRFLANQWTTLFLANFSRPTMPSGIVKAMMSKMADVKKGR